MAKKMTTLFQWIKWMTIGFVSFITCMVFYSFGFSVGTFLFL